MNLIALAAESLILSLFPLPAEGQCGPKSLKERSSGKVHFYYLNMVIRRKKKRGVGDVPFT